MNTSMIDIVKYTGELLENSEICAKEAFRVRELSDKLANQQITISVIGQFKRGKSTLLNKMLGEKLLPVGIVPVTSAVTRIQYGEKAAAVHFGNGIVRPVAFEALSEYISEQKNPDNERGVASVTLKIPAAFLMSGITLVDTPGVGSFHKHNSDAAYAFIKESDAVIFTLSVDSPINEIEINFLKSAKEYAAKFYFAVNKIDVVSEEELSAYLDYCRRLICQIMEVESVNMYAVSAKNGEGVSTLKESIQNDCEEVARKIIEDSVGMKLKDIIGSALAQLGLYWNALKMPIGRFDNRFKSMEKYLEDLQKNKKQVRVQLEREADRMIEAFEQTITSHKGEILCMEDSLCKEAQASLNQEMITKLQDACWEMSNEMEARLNEMKTSLADTVSELFGMEYHYEMKTLNLGREEKEGQGTKFKKNELLKKDWEEADDNCDRLFEKMFLNYTFQIRSCATNLAERFESEQEKICNELQASLNHILMYRETSTYIVARRIEDLNILTRNLKKIRNQL